MTIPFRRKLRLGSRGRDCVAVKRALAHAGFGDLRSPATHRPVFGPFAVRNLKAFCGRVVYDRPAHAKLERFFDHYSAALYVAPEDPALAKARAMLAFCREFDGGYVWGGEHDDSFADDSPHDGFDCSSSVSFVLWHFGLLGWNRAHVAVDFMSWGEPGRGKYVTVHAAPDHVWIELDLPDGWYRFDTSPRGCGPRGPRVRTCRRDTARFVSRHPRGL